MTRRQIATVAAIVVVGLALGIGVIYSLGLSNRGLAGAYSASGQSLQMTFQGAYRDGTTYIPGDVVTSDGSAYIALGETYQAPPDVPWTLLAAAGPTAGPIQAPWAAGWEKVETEVELPVWNSPTTATASCPSAKRFVSGGWTFKYHWLSHRVTPLTQSITEPNGAGVGAGYQMTFLNNGSTKDYVFVYAICVNA